MFALDTFRHWAEGTAPYAYKLYSEVNRAEWMLLLCVTCGTFIFSLAWALAEIFRENVINVGNVKSDVEFYVEGLSVHIIAIIWIVTVCIVTMPGGAASLIGNLYFTTWSTLISVIGTLIWFVRDWRKMILDIIQEQQDEYDFVKKTFREREEKRLAKLARKSTDKTGEVGESEEESSDMISEESKTEEDDDVVLCDDDPDVDDDITISIASGWRGPASVTSSARASPDKTTPVDDDITISIASGWRGPASVTLSPCASPDKTTPADSVAVPVSSSIFMSAMSFFYSSTGDQPAAYDVADDEK